MIKFALVGVADERHRLFVEPVRRRRAGVRVVGFSEPDEAARSDFAVLHPIPGFASHHELLEAARPSMVAIASPADDTLGVIRDAVAGGIDVIVAPPVATSMAGLAELVGMATDSGRRIVVVHTYRNHPAARLARELIDQGRLGAIQQVVLEAAESVSEDQLATATREALDLFHWFTGATAGSVASPTTAEGLRQVDGLDEQVIMAVHGQGLAGEAVFEVVRNRGAARTPLEVQVAGDHGAVGWSVANGTFRSMIDDGPITVVAAGLPGDQAQWVLTDLVRRRISITASEALLTTRLCLLAVESKQRGGSVLDWQI